LFYTPKEEPAKLAIENLMGAEITEVEFPEQVQVSTQLTPDERPETGFTKTIRRKKAEEKGAAFHEKSLKNQKTNQGGSYKRMIEKKYKKPKSKGDKNFNQRYNKKK